MIDGDGFNDYVDEYDGTQGWLSVRSFAAAANMIALVDAGKQGYINSRESLMRDARERIDMHYDDPDSEYRLRLALGASYVLLRLEYGDQLP